MKMKPSTKLLKKRLINARIHLEAYMQAERHSVGSQLEKYHQACDNEKRYIFKLESLLALEKKMNPEREA